MKFEQYIKLARKVFPDLPPQLESMKDELFTYQFIFNYVCPYDTSVFDNFTDSQKMDLFSLSNATTMQMRHIHNHGHSIWE